MTGSRPNRRALAAVATVQTPVRVAIYTRRSTIEDPDTGLTAVDRQREAGEAFVRSQSEQAWTAIPERYDDAGYTGANTDRPALERLLVDVDAGLVDVLLVSRLDRLTRSLADFVRLHEHLQARGVHLASIAESIDTGSPAGRMMVSLLAAFGQYERELIAARTKDKLGAARRRGRFTGGALVLGYDRDPSGARLIVNESEAETVRAIFRLFIERRSLVATLREIHGKNWTLKRWVTKQGRTYGGGQFDKNTLRRLLTNYTYVGKVEFQGSVYDGEHKGIVPMATFKEVQKIFDANQRGPVACRPNKFGALLKGLLRCSQCDRAMSHQWTRSHGRVYRYYGCAAKEGRAACATKSIPALDVERFVVDRIRCIGRDPELRKATFREALAQLARERKVLRAESKRLERERVCAKRDVDRLVATVAGATGKAREALMEALSAAQASAEGIAVRIKDAGDRLHSFDFRRLDEGDLGRALEAFDDVWEALLVPERERVINLLIERINYDGVTKQLTIEYKPTGIATLAAEVAS